MLIEILAVLLFAKLKRFRISLLFRSWTIYPVLIVQLFVIACETSIFFHSNYFIRFAPITAPAVILSFCFAVVVYRLYKPAILGSLSVVLGSSLNRFVIAQNGGSMPVFPSLSYFTGYADPTLLGEADQLHILGDGTVKYKFLTDYIDFGYSILSIGDVFIHFFFCIMLYSMIIAANNRFSYSEKIQA